MVLDWISYYFNNNSFPGITDEDTMEETETLYKIYNAPTTAINRFRNSPLFEKAYENREVIVFRIKEKLGAKIPWERPINERWYLLGGLMSGLTVPLALFFLFFKRKTLRERNEKI